MKTLAMLRRREDEALDAPLKRLDAATAQSSGRLVDEVNTASANIRYEILLPVNIALAGRLRSMWHYDMQNAMRDARVFQAMNVFGRPDILDPHALNDGVRRNRRRENTREERGAGQHRARDPGAA
jgi:hypothetical protein